MQLGDDVQRYLADQSAFENNGASKSPAWLKDIRSAARGKFTQTGFPTIKHEDWRFTNISPITKTSFHRVAENDSKSVARTDLAKFIIPEASKSVLVFVNGHFRKDLSDMSALPKSVSAGSLAEFAHLEEKVVRDRLNKEIPLNILPFAALNGAFLYDGAFVHVPEKIKTPSPIQLLYLSTEDKDRRPVAYPRNLLLVDRGASATVVETYASLAEGVYFTNAVTEAFIEEESAVDYIKVQNESEKAYHVGTMQVQQRSRSRFTAFSLALGSAIARNDLNIVIDGEQCETMLDGLYIPANDQLVDHHTFIDHTRPNCSSREIFKGIVAGNSRSVFNGKIFVRQAAQKTDSKQTNKNLLLSDAAIVDTKPQLEIFADDVKCTHGATVGGLDAASLFYVKSRGISEDAARALLTVGFAGEVTNYINDEHLRKYVDSLVIERLREKVVKAALPEIVHSSSQE